MARYLARRVSQSVAVLFIVSVIVFSILHFLPGSPARAILGIRATPGAIQAFNNANGYNRALPVQYLLYVDRAKDLISRGGMKISAAEVEGLLQSCPGVAEVAAIGVADPILGERLCAVVVPRASASRASASLAPASASLSWLMACFRDGMAQRRAPDVNSGERRARAQGDDDRQRPAELRLLVKSAIHDAGDEHGS